MFSPTAMPCSVGGASLTQHRKLQAAPFRSIHIHSHAASRSSVHCTADDRTKPHGHPQSASETREHMHSRRVVLTIPLITIASNYSSALAKSYAGASGGDWTSPGLAAVEDDAAPKFYKTPSGVKIQELRVGSGPAAKQGDRVEIEYVLRRANGYFIYSTVEGVSFQPRDIPTGPLDLTLGDGRNIAGLEEVLEGMQPAGKRRALIPPQLGYVTEGLLPQPPGFAAKRQVLNHASEGLIFEVQLVKIRS